MKEQRYFYHPAPLDCELPSDEASHATRVLRLQAGDEICLMDGCGTFYEAVITQAGNHHCRYDIISTLPQQPAWRGQIHLAVAPTKNVDRMEWLAEKATEIGMDRLTLLDCRFSERRALKTDRLERIIISAMKQSHKAWKPTLEDMQPFASFIKRSDLPAQRFIAHCYDQADIDSTAAPDAAAAKPHLHSLLQAGTYADCLVLVGPEGDFSIDEVHAAQQHGFRSISLGTSRLRTETAALVAVHLMRLAAE